MRSPKAKAFKKPSKGKLKNELRNKITNYFQLQDVKTSAELETSDSLSLNESADQSVVAGVGPKSEADSSSEWEKLSSHSFNTIYNNLCITSYIFADWLGHYKDKTEEVE